MKTPDIASESVVHPSSASSRRGGRIAFIDLARSVAISLAMFSHGMLVFGSYGHMPLEVRKATLVIIHVAAPTFVLLFGAMLEIVYVRKIRQGEARSVYRRLMRRGGLCYLGFVLTVAAALVGGRLDAGAAVAAAFSLGPAQLGSALKFYTFALLAAPLLLGIRCRWGVRSVLMLAGLYWLATLVLDGAPWPEPTHPFAQLTGFLTGYPKGVAYISMGHALTLVGVGMLLGWSLRRDEAAGTSRTYWTVVIAVVSLASVVVAILVWRLGPLGVLGGYAAGFRKVHHVGYYAIALIEALGLISLLRRLAPVSVPEKRIPRPVLLFGQHSLLAFSTGNAFLLALPAREWTLGQSLGLSLAFLVLLNLWLMAAESGRRWLSRLGGGGEARIRYGSDRTS